ncbi:MAG: GH32 C-terminal domain-containing protein [Tannerella sp.]|jgi:fructan beta-fructosidase|nr:GH32 C-terminal domain-containing protein [Tannerella sp.]
MRHYQFILSFIIASFFCSCTEKNAIQITQTENGTAIHFKASGKYLLLPVEDTGDELKTEVIVNNTSENYFIIRLAKNKIDYWMPMDISAWEGKEIKLNIEKLNNTAICLKNIKQANSFDFDYNEKYRPDYHFTPLYGWMNDPNGMVYYDREYHLCYQHNPFGTRWQNMSWGHAVSKDLVHWEYLSEALYPDSLGTIFSGSAVVDENNTAGFQTGNEKVLLAFYSQSERGGQWQSLAYSNDKGRTWTKYDKNPVLKHETARDFRDPKVFWHESSQKWMMILAVGQVMEIYSSTNAKDWIYESNFGEGYGCHGGVWECPDLVELPVEGANGLKKWVLICNINPGGPSGGSASQYFIGNFDGKTFQCENNPEEVNWMDWGKDHYAFVSWANIPKEDGRCIGIAWMSNWEYANDVPTQNFRSAMTVPRELKLIKKDNSYKLTNYPVKEIENKRSNPAGFSNMIVKEEHNIDNLLENNQGVFELVIDIENKSSEIIGFKLFNGKGEYIDIFISLAEKKLYIDRKNSGTIGFNNHFPAVTYAPVDKKQNYQFRLLIDKASIECFEGNGEISMTNLIFPGEPYNRISFYSKGGEYNVRQLNIYNLNNTR